MCSSDLLTADDANAMAQSFHDLHERMFTYNVTDSSVDLFHWRVVATRKVAAPETPPADTGSTNVEDAKKGTRRVYFGDINDYRETNIYDGDALVQGMEVKGPAVVEQQNTTIVVFPGQSISVNKFGDFVLAL